MAGFISIIFIRSLSSLMTLSISPIYMSFTKAPPRPDVNSLSPFITSALSSKRYPVILPSTLPEIIPPSWVLIILKAILLSSSTMETTFAQLSPTSTTLPTIPSITVFWSIWIP